MNPTAQPRSLHGYYQQRGLTPTFAALADQSALDEYAGHRARFFFHKLHLPPVLFRGARLVEFGPDTGENALAFATWGALLTLVEPNPNAWPKIAEYFERFQLGARLHRLEKVNLERFETAEQFDFIDAEGFIYTVQPSSVWIDLFARLLKPGGTAIVSYTERHGSLFELLHRAIYAHMRRLSDRAPVDLAHAAFRTKWDSIPHTRTFESWVLDVLENPFVRRAYFLDAIDVYQRWSTAGLRLYSSWPVYADHLSVYWHKRDMTSEEELSRDCWFIARSRVSFLLGRKAFLCSPEEPSIAAVGEALALVLSGIDRLIDGCDEAAVVDSLEGLGRIRRTLTNDPVLFDSRDDQRESVAMVDSVAAIVRLLHSGDLDGVVAWCNADRAFVHGWGQPTHYAVFTKGHDEVS